MRSKTHLAALLFALLAFTPACRPAEEPTQEAPVNEPAQAASAEEAPAQAAVRAAAVAALDSLVAELVTERPADAAAYAERLRAYLEVHPTFYGAAAALLDETGSVIASPYVHRAADGHRALDLAQPDYNIDEQEWVAMPLAANAGVWTPPYFDAGGGEIWMVTRSVPARDSGGVFAIVTTDLPVEAPAGC